MKTIISSNSFLLASVSTVALCLVSISSATASTVATITFDEVVTGSTSFGFDGDNDTVDDVIFTTSDNSGFNTIGPGANQTYIQEPGLEGTTLLNPDLRVDFLRGATERLSFGFALNSAVEDENFLAGIAVYDSSDKLLGFQAEVGRYTSTSLGTSSFPEGEVNVGFSGTASYAELSFESQFGRYIIDNFAGNFGSDAIPIQRSNGPTDTAIDSRKESFDRTKPTIVITHGRQPTGTFDRDIDSVEFLAAAYDEIESKYGDQVNIVVFTWEAAFVNGGSDGEFEMPRQAANSGIDLGVELKRLLGDSNTYDQAIHFVGHSYGTIVNSVATTFLTNRNYTVDHFTILDAPTSLPAILPDVPLTYYTRLIENDSVTYVENYYATRKLEIDNRPDITFGEAIQGTALDGGYGLEEDHASIQGAYIDTIKKEFVTVAEGGFFYSAALGSDGYFSIRPNKDQSITPLLSASSNLNPILALNASFDSPSQIGSIQTGSNGYLVFETLIPDFADLMLFDLLFDMPGDGDFLEVQLGDDVLGVFAGSSFLDWTNVALGVQQYAGAQDFLTFLLVSDGPEPASLKFSNVEFLGVARSLAPVPLPAGLPLLLGGLMALAGLRAHKTRATRC